MARIPTSFVVQHYLVFKGVGTLADASWQITPERMPDDEVIDNRIMVIGTGSVKQGSDPRSGRIVSNPTFTVHIRAANFPLGWSKGEEIRDVLAALKDEVVAVPGYGNVSVHRIHMKVDLTKIREEEINKRNHFTISFLITYNP